MDPDSAFAAVELIIPEEQLEKDGELQKAIAPPHWEAYTYAMD